MANHKTGARMTAAERAKQFMPFAALKGYEDALRKVEKVVREKVELSEEKKEELDRLLHVIRKNDMVRAVYYEDGEYLEITGMVARLDVTAGILKIVQTKIPFENLYDLESVGKAENKKERE